LTSTAECENLHAEFLQFFRHLQAALFLGARTERDSPIFRQAFGHLPTEPYRATGDDRHAACEIEDRLGCHIAVSPDIPNDNHERCLYHMLVTTAIFHAAYKPQNIRRRADKLYAPLRASSTCVVAGTPIRPSNPPASVPTTEIGAYPQSELPFPGIEVIAWAILELRSRAGFMLEPVVPASAEYEAPHQRANEEWPQPGGQIRA